MAGRECCPTHRHPCLTCPRLAQPLHPRPRHGGLNRRLPRRGRWDGGSREQDRSQPLQLFKASTQVSLEKPNIKHQLQLNCDSNFSIFTLLRQISLQVTRTSPSTLHSAHLSHLITSQHPQRQTQKSSHPTTPALLPLLPLYLQSISIRGCWMQTSSRRN